MRGNQLAATSFPLLLKTPDKDKQLVLHRGNMSDPVHLSSLRHCFVLVASLCQMTPPVLRLGTAPTHALLRTTVVKPPSANRPRAGHGSAVCLCQHEDLLEISALVKPNCATAHHEKYCLGKSLYVPCSPTPPARCDQAVLVCSRLCRKGELKYNGGSRPGHCVGNGAH